LVSKISNLILVPSLLRMHIRLKSESTMSCVGNKTQSFLSFADFNIGVMAQINF